jgi:tetratricopeptide (TPR) repeat protein
VKTLSTDEKSVAGAGRGENPRVNQLAQLARETMRAGRASEAMRIWQQVLAIAPAHPQALFHLGAYALYRKEPARAQKLLAEAADADPNAAPIALNLAYAYRDLGDAQNEMAAITRALTIDPYYFPALLAQGILTERIGSVRAAAKVYVRALASMPPEEDIPRDLREAAAHAREVVQGNAAALQAFIADRLSSAISRHPKKTLERFEESKGIALGTRKIYTQDATMLLVPWLPPIQYYDDDLFPWMTELEKMTDVIRDEMKRAMSEDAGGFLPYVQRTNDAPLDQWRDLNHSRQWSAYFFWKDGRRFDEACLQCPQTARVEKIVPTMEARNFGPTIMYSALSPKTHLPAHSGATNARLIVHLPLIVPGNCRFRVGNETREWREGKAWVFDDTIEHEAWNDSSEMRVILLLDTWNPFITEAERELIPALLNGLNEYYSG